MAPKMMACRALDGEHMPIQAFQEAQNSFFFTEDGNEDVCYIAPYVVATDGTDVLVWQRSDELLEIGWRFHIEKESSWWPFAKLPDFDTLVEAAVKHSFYSLWKHVRTHSKIPSDIKYGANTSINPIVKIGAEYEDLSEDFVHIHCTNRGTYNINKKFFFPVYFVMLPSDRTVNLIPEGEEKPCIPVQFKWLASKVGEIPMSFEAKKIMDMIKAGEIILPIINK